MKVYVCVNIFTWNHKEFQNNNRLKRNKNIIKSNDREEKIKHLIQKLKYKQQQQQIPILY